MNVFDGQIFLIIAFSAVIFFTLGGLAGYLVSLLRTPNQPIKENKVVKTSTTQSLVEPSTDSGKIEVARIYRRSEDDQVFLETNGRPLQTPADVRSTERGWLVLAAEAIYQLLSQEPIRAQNTPPVPPAASALPPIEWNPETPVEFQKPSMNPADVIIRAAQAGQSRLDHPKSLIEQIDAVLQELLKQSPLPAGEVRLSENAALGLEVRVGKQRYDGIEAVPDEQVRQVIRSAIAEWQRRSQQRKN